MEKRDKADELIKSLSSVEPLEEVPSDISVRFHETLRRLSDEKTLNQHKTKRFSNANQFALAASFVLVFALGAVVTLNSGDSPTDQLGIAKPQTSAGSSKTDISDDQIQYSGSDKSIPESSGDAIKQTASSHDYKEIPMDFNKKLGVGSTWNSAAKLDSVILQCLRQLELDNSTNLVDAGFFQGKSVKAVWTPLTNSSWNVYLVDSSCTVLDKKFVQG